MNNEFISNTASKILLPKIPHLTDVPATINLNERKVITNYYYDSICELEVLLDIDLCKWKTK